MWVNRSWRKIACLEEAWCGAGHRGPASLLPPVPYFSAMSSISRARLQLIGAALLFSTGGAAIKAAAFTGWQIASFRSGFAALALLLIVALSPRDITRAPRKLWKPLLVGCAYAACLTLF